MNMFVDKLRMYVFFRFALTHGEIDFWFLLDRVKSNCICRLPIDLEPTKIAFDAKSPGGV